MQVSHAERFDSDPQCYALARSRLKLIQKNYLPESWGAPPSSDFGLADPLLALEKLARSGSRLPPGFASIFIPTGGADPILSDSIRLQASLEKLGHVSRIKIYPGQGHAFYSQIFGTSQQECWDDIQAFLTKT